MGGQALEVIAILPIGKIGKVFKLERMAAKVVRELPRALRGGQATTHVYVGVRGGERVYVGITNDVARRQAEHSGRFVLQRITQTPVTRGEARAIEQALISRNPGFENVRNSISPVIRGMARPLTGARRGCKQMDSEMNLEVLKTTRKAPAVGDIFVMKPGKDLFLFGRVIDVDADPLGAGGGVLIYIYEARSLDKAKVPDLLVNHLLVPPIITNKQPWSKGYFEHVENRPLSSSDHLRQHCFRDSRGWYFDQVGNRLAGPSEPVGQWGLHSFRTIDDEISAALGIPLAPE